MHSTHEVFNQAVPLEDYDLYSTDPILRASTPAWAQERLQVFGTFCGSAEAIELGFQANRNGPVLQTHSRFGHRIDEVEFHPAYHRLMQASIEHGVHNMPWIEVRAGAHTARAGLLYIAAQNEAGHCCPVSMTYAVVPALRKQPDLAAIWEPRITSSKYDPRMIPADQKAGVTIGMGMTEKQGGSDVRANTTRAETRGDGSWAITGHKWFCSAPMSDAFLMLAQAPRGLSCFLVPRFTASGVRNAVAIQRLKDKLGNRSNASSEIELHRAEAYLVGEQGRGVATIIDMVNHTRLDCTVSSAALMRQALVQAIHHCRHRAAFGKLLIDQPLMTNVLADLALEWEAATRLAFRVAESYDDPTQGPFRRIASAIAKYWVCKRTPVMIAEALECLGGNGYVEESILPRLFRESPLAGIWEGSGNVICLDVLRAMKTNPATGESVVAELRKTPELKAVTDAIEQELASPIEEQDARRVVERIAIALQASLMIRHSAQAGVFIATRLHGKGGFAFGTLPPQTNARKIVDTAWIE